MVCDEKRGTLRRKEGDANEKQALNGRMNGLRGRPKRRWLDKVKDGLKEKRLSADDVYDSATWRRMSSYKSTPHKSGNKMKEKKKEEW